LTLTQDELFANLHAKHRNVIKKAQKEKLEITKNTLDVVDNCFDLFRDTMQRSKMDYPSREYLRKLFDKMPENIYCAQISQDGVVQGAIYLYYTLERSYYMYGGSLIRPSTGAMNYLHWDAMMTLKSIGVQSYDFVGARINPPQGSKLEGIQRFKERFGGTLYEGYMWKYIFNKPKYHLYVLLLKLVALKNNTTYKGDIIDQENSR
jgi:lipid II:glycine glycyltransferase (peptidoglycan interpeptide bridge formation enzyme)